MTLRAYASSAAMLAPNRLRVRPASPVRVHLLAGTFGLWLGLACTGCGQGCSGEQGAEGTSTASATATSAEQDPNANGRTNGLTPEQATGFAVNTNAAVAANLAQEEAQTTAKVATQTVNDAVGVLRGDAGDVVRSIRAFAELQANPNAVYALAQIPAPAAAARHVSGRTA